MANKVQDLCYRCGLMGLHEQRVGDFAKEFSEEAAIEVLNTVLKTRDFQRSSSKRPDAAQYLWNKHSAAYKKVAGGRKREREQEAAHKAQEASYRATIESGYEPNHDTLLAQLNEQLESGKLSAQKYEEGMAGLSVVYGMVGAAKDGLTPDEQAVVDGYDERIGV